MQTRRHLCLVGTEGPNLGLLLLGLRLSQEIAGRSPLAERSILQTDGGGSHHSKLMSVVYT